MACCTFYIMFGSGERQSWDQDPNGNQNVNEKKKRGPKETKIETTCA